MSNPFFSIIIPTYNRAHYLVDALRSCINQAYQNFEVIIVDDGGFDDSKQVVESFKDPRLKYFWKENAERGAARNFGVKKALGEYVFFLDSDDWILPNHLCTAFEEIKKTKPVVFHSRYMSYYEVDGVYKNCKPIRNLDKEIIEGNVLGCLTFIKRSIALENPYSEIRELSGSEDRLLNLKLKAKFSIHYSNKITYVIREHSTRSMASGNLKTWLKQKEILKEEIFKNDVLIKFFGKKKLEDIICYFDIMLSLKQIINGEKIDGWKRYFSAFAKRPNTFSIVQFLRMVKYSI